MIAENQSMTTAEVVAKSLIDEHADFLREAVVIVARELMEAEIPAEIGATRGEVSDERTTHRNGYRSRAWETRVGEIELAAARKARRLLLLPELPAATQALGISGIDKDRVSRLGRELDERDGRIPQPSAGGRVPLSLARRQAAEGA